MKYSIEYQPEAEAELDAIGAYQRAIILRAIEKSLQYEPMVITKKRKPVQPVGVVVELGITWALTVGAFRVGYDVHPPSSVVVIRIVRKGNLTTEESFK
jgi:mRNA-degrading endonuclease RelE of RelBE toxin-antitoxin system